MEFHTAQEETIRVWICIRRYRKFGCISFEKPYHSVARFAISIIMRKLPFAYKFQLKLLQRVELY